ncbi:MAG: 2-dehydropantoate 2-reductase [Rectinemataceae bacterium]|nr:2-dehydropantoate 2-reductase [Spirochaetaceae bacterium]
MSSIDAAVVVGAGAVGASLAAMLAEINPASVFVSASGERQERYRRRGFVVNGKTFHFRMADPSMVGAADLIIVAVKNYHLEEAIEEMRPFVGAHTIILSLLNGVTAVPRLRAEFGADKVPLAMILGIDAHRKENQIHYSKRGEIYFGFEQAYARQHDSRIRAVARFFDAHRIQYRIPADILREVWFKFMLNVGLNQWSAVLRAPYGIFVSNPHARSLLIDTMREVVQLSEKLQTGLQPGDVERALTVIAGMPPQGQTSMLQDVLAGRKTEVDAFAGAVVNLAQQEGLAVPLNQALYRALSVLEGSVPAGAEGLA